MGETYLVRHAFLRENLVLKRIRPELAEDPLYQQSFLREAHSLAALRKLPSVVEIRNAWQTREGYLALLLEYVEGGNLLQWLETTRGGGPLELLESEIPLVNRVCVEPRPRERDRVRESSASSAADCSSHWPYAGWSR
jgi:serine/threonine protein kinase